MEKRIELERRGRCPDAIPELNLDNCRATQIEGLTDEYVNLQSLSLINVGLTTLKGFPNLPNLKRLELSDNRINAGLDNLKGCPKLQYINLSGNKIKDIETLQKLGEPGEFTELRNLDLFNCEVTNVENYREKVFELLKDLEYLDGFDKSGGEAEDLDPDDADGDDDEDVSDDEEDDEENALDEEEEDDSEDEDGLQDEDDDDEDDDEDEVGLDYLQKEDLSDDDDEFDPEAGQPEDEEEEGEEGEVQEIQVEGDEARGVKRKLEDEEEQNA